MCTRLRRHRKTFADDDPSLGSRWAFNHARTRLHRGRVRAALDGDPFHDRRWSRRRRRRDPRHAPGAIADGVFTAVGPMSRPARAATMRSRAGCTRQFGARTRGAADDRHTARLARATGESCRSGLATAAISAVCTTSTCSPTPQDTTRSAPGSPPRDRNSATTRCDATETPRCCLDESGQHHVARTVTWVTAARGVLTIAPVWRGNEPPERQQMAREQGKCGSHSAM